MEDIQKYLIENFHLSNETNSDAKKFGEEISFDENMQFRIPALNGRAPFKRVYYTDRPNYEGIKGIPMKYSPEYVGQKGSLYCVTTVKIPLVEIESYYFPEDMTVYSLRVLKEYDTREAIGKCESGVHVLPEVFTGENMVQPLIINLDRSQLRAGRWGNDIVDYRKNIMCRVEEFLNSETLVQPTVKVSYVAVIQYYIEKQTGHEAANTV